MWKLTKGFHLPLTAFLTDWQDTTVPRTPVRFPGSITVAPVFPFDPLVGSETFLVTLDPGQEHVSHPHDAGVVEDVVVTLGTVEVLRDGNWAPCARNDGLRFAADQPHGYRNPSDAPAQFLNVLHYPQLP